MTLRLMLAAFLITAGVATAEPLAEHPQLKAFPTAATGMTRFVITLADKERGEEANFKVELLAGKTLMADGINKLTLGSSLEAQPLEGWGYTYYQVSGSDKVMSTLMAVPEGHQQVEQFVGGKPLIIRYNSRLPIVVYAPDGYEIRYRIWQAPATLINAGPQ
jgi:ecotin